jgi:hypothetical protein
MPTVTNSIGSGGGRDYSTIALWLAALPANLVTDGNSYTGQCYNDSEFLVTAQILIGGHTTDSSHFITLTTGPGQSFRDNANVQTNALNYNQANGVAIRSTTGYLDPLLKVNDQFTVVSNFQMSYGAGSTNTVVYQVNATSVLTQNCIIVENSNLPMPIMSLGGIGPSCKLFNCALITNTTSNGANTGSGINLGNQGLHQIENCTVFSVQQAGGTSCVVVTALGGHYQGLNRIVNVAGFGFGKFTDDTTNFTSTLSGWNCTDLASTTVPGGSNQVLKTFANQFQNISSISTADARLKIGADCVNNGTTASGDIGTSQDIAGTIRPQGAAWDIGAWELVMAAAAFSGNVIGLGASEW